MQNNVSNKKELQFYWQCPVIAEASDFSRTFPNISKRSFSLNVYTHLKLEDAQREMERLERIEKEMKKCAK